MKLMTATKKNCRVCGCRYEPCRTSKRVDGVFRWQEVACSEKCGAIYLERIRASRINDSSMVATKDTSAGETVKKRARRVGKRLDATENTEEVSD